ncbi:MAG: hypothetical protein Q9167_005089 [Letrouitia subvulpina]
MAQHVPDRGPALAHAMIALIVLCDVSVVLRFVSRKISKASFGYDDYLAIAAMLLANGTAICVLVAVSYDVGKHIEDARPDAVLQWHKVLYVYENFYAPAIATTKFSILFFYNRIFSIKNFRIVLYAIGMTVMMWWIVMQFTVIFECAPIDLTWSPHKEGHCISLKKFFLGQAIPNIATDLVLLLIPIPMIWNLQLPRSQKVALIGVFLLGGFVVCASTYRLILLFKFSPTAPDITCMLFQADIPSLPLSLHWTYFHVIMWSAVEPNVGVISACLPLHRPIFKIFIHKAATLKDLVSGSHSMQPNFQPGTDKHDFVRLVGHEGDVRTRNDLMLLELGNRTMIERNQDMGEEDSGVPIGSVHVRKDINIEDNNDRMQAFSAGD